MNAYRKGAVVTTTCGLLPLTPPHGVGMPRGGAISKHLRTARPHICHGWGRHRECPICQGVRDGGQPLYPGGGILRQGPHTDPCINRSVHPYPPPYKVHIPIHASIELAAPLPYLLLAPLLYLLAAPLPCLLLAPLLYLLAAPLLYLLAAPLLYFLAAPSMCLLALLTSQ